MTTARHLAKIEARLAEQGRLIEQLVRIIPAAAPGPVLTLEEAVRYIHRSSDSAFYRWTAKWRVTACAQGRYSRGHLDRALQREAATRGTTKRAA